MLKPAMWVLGVATLTLVASTAARAQCLTFSPTLACSPLTPPRSLFGLSLPRPSIAPKTSVVVPTPPASLTGSESTGLDCKMVRPVDPAFHSAMPVATPDPNVSLPMRVIPAPPCVPPR